jgi:preprotein translocase subunit SecA|tara:strand:- start:2740 stop:3141 length:402 start_codon:yes stop_codon:yes gene_type:complete
MIVDESTGRVQQNRRWNDNIHQAVEAKEGVEIKRENATVASVSYQCLFKLYKKLSGMTGTASTESEELFTTYGLQGTCFPPNTFRLCDCPYQTDTFFFTIKSCRCRRTSRARARTSRTPCSEPRKAGGTRWRI